MREWIVTNGLGGYASLTYYNKNISKFNGLLIASLNPPTDRWLFVSNVFDKVRIKNDTYCLKDFKPEFSYDYFPSFYYELEGVKIKKTFFMENGKNTSIIRYEVKTDKPVSITHNALVNSRHFYYVTSKRYLVFEQDVFDNGVYIKPANTDKTLKIILKDAKYKPLHYWEGCYYEKDRERNDSWIDNIVHIGNFYKTIKKSKTYYLVLTIENETYNNPSKIFTKEIQRKKRLFDQSDLPGRFQRLVLSSDNFIVKKGEEKSVIAGYPWFGDWGRDTLIALPGLTLVTKRYDDSKNILLNFSKYCKNGLIPNVFMDRNSEAVYNTVDTALWYVDRVFQYLKYTYNLEILDNIWPTLQSIIERYKNGTEYDIHMDNDYLISHNPGLTWMDVKIDNYYPTPRSKKAVEIQALWYNALMIMSNLSQLYEKDDRYFDLAELVKDSFNAQYDKQFDVIDTRDLSCRPNQIFLVSLDFPMIDKKLKEKIVKTTQDKLVTIFGLRTLSTEDPNYKGSYIGNYNRDIAYHNGTVWPWLMGSFIKAFVKVKNQRKYAYDNFIKPMLQVYGDNWDGSIYEIFDGDSIYAPRGCITQAWSVAEILRCWVEDIENIKPKYENVLNSSEIPA